MEKNFFYQISEPCFFLVEKSKDAFDNYLNSFRNDKTKRNVVKLLRGEKMKLLDGLFNETSSALQFPSYFGENWDALNECLNDLDWLSGDNYIIAINDIQDVLICEESKQMDIFMRILRNTCLEWSKPYDIDKDWGRPGKPFHIVFQYSSQKKDIVLQRMSKYL